MLLDQRLHELFMLCQTADCEAALLVDASFLTPSTVRLKVGIKLL